MFGRVGQAREQFSPGGWVGFHFGPLGWGPCCKHLGIMIKFRNASSILPQRLRPNPNKNLATNRPSPTQKPRNQTPACTARPRESKANHVFRLTFGARSLNGDWGLSCPGLIGAPARCSQTAFCIALIELLRLTKARSSVNRLWAESVLDAVVSANFRHSSNKSAASRSCRATAANSSEVNSWARSAGFFFIIAGPPPSILTRGKNFATILHSVTRLAITV